MDLPGPFQLPGIFQPESRGAPENEALRRWLAANGNCRTQPVGTEGWAAPWKRIGGAAPILGAEPASRSMRRNRMPIVTKYEAKDTAERAAAWELLDA